MKMPDADRSRNIALLRKVLLALEEGREEEFAIILGVSEPRTEGDKKGEEITALMYGQMGSLMGITSEISKSLMEEVVPGGIAGLNGLKGLGTGISSPN